MGTGCTPDNTYGSYHAGYGRNDIGHNGRIFSMATDAYLLLVCRTDADCRQFYQRFIRLSERYGPGRPLGPRTRLRARVDFTQSDAEWHHRYHRIGLPCGQYAVVLRRMGAYHCRTAVHIVRFSLHDGTLPFILSWLG